MFRWNKNQRRFGLGEHILSFFSRFERVNYRSCHAGLSRRSVWTTSAQRPHDTAHDLREAIMEDAVQRVRPKMMTVAAIMGGLLPIMWTTGTGADVMKRIAAPMIGGMVSSTVLTLLVIPILYALWRSRSIPAVDRQLDVSSAHIVQSEQP